MVNTTSAPEYPRAGAMSLSTQQRNSRAWHARTDIGPKITAVMADSTKHNNYQHRVNSVYGAGGNMYANHYALRAQAGQGYGMHHKHTPDLTSLAHSIQGVNIQHPPFPAQAKNPMMSHHGGNYNPLAVPSTMPAAIYGATGQYVFPSSYSASSNNPSPGIYTPHAAQHMSQVTYPGYRPHDNSPLPQNWTPTTGTGGEVPTLITPRRDSISSNENDQPTTPMYAGYPGFSHHASVAINRSPSGMYTHSTPSPNSMVIPYGSQMSKQPDQSDVSPRIKLLVGREPPIPRAIPAPSSPLKPLDRALENQRGETNVYIRGLLPETTDEQLESWGSRFGDIKSSKSIVDLNSGQCKGYGFVKYHNYEDAENCIRGFHYLGYEVSFARESFYSKLKTFADEQNTNLYVSNLPKSMNEHELANLFDPHKVCSSRILRDRNGDGRGVGFARFETRDVCEEVIKTFNNHTIKTNEEELQIQIRYADTQEQKTLKQQTQAARQFRSAEYEYATHQWRQGRLPFAGTTVQVGNNTNEFDQYLGTTAAVPIQGQRWAQSVIRSGPGRSPLGVVPVNTSSTQTPHTQASLASGSENHHSTNDEPVESKAHTSSPVTVHSSSPVDSATTSDHD